MPGQIDHNAQSLRSAIAWALQLADAQEQTLIAAYLADALFHADALEQSGET